MTGTYLNVSAVIVGSTIGALMGSKLKNKYKELTIHAIGCATLALGASWFMSVKSPVTGITAIGCFIFGGLIGELMHIDFGLNKLGQWAEGKLSKNGDGKFQQAFVTTSILFCIGPMTVLGCIQDGLGQGIALLVLKSILDFISSAFFAAALGWGVMLSALSVLLIQGGLTLTAGLIHGVDEFDPRIHTMTATGGMMLIALAITLLNIKPIRVANFLPGIFIAPIVVWILMLLHVIPK